MTLRRRLAWIIGAFALVAITGAAPLVAQNRFEPVIRVDDDVITRYQLDERTRFLALLRAPGDPRELARDQLINELIQTRVAQAAGIELNEQALRAGTEEFAGRANLTAEQFVAALAQEGVGAETFRDFIGAGVVWRAYVRDTFSETARDFPIAAVGRALTRTGTEGGFRVLLSEILLPATTPETAAASRARAGELGLLEDEAAFAAAARQFSVARSRGRGGAQSWAAIDALPENVRVAIAGLEPGQISRPVELENAIGVFLLRDSERILAGAPEDLAIEYALFLTGGGPEEARRIAGRVDVCDDLYGVAQGLPEERLIRETAPAAALPPDIRAAIETLDANEISTDLTRGGQTALLMLCGRRLDAESTVDLDIAGNQILNLRLNGIAADHLADLRGNAYIADLTN
ncbi:MAG: peptidylprolyl isomerase [Paracoccaceae bacterium]|nr:peptidylprolyl isomerase [Paracoccaceae bacterium]